MDFSVLMSIYKNSDADELQQCFDSLTSQKVKAAQYVLVIDGPISDTLKKKVEELKGSVEGLDVIPLETNHGLGLALREGMQACKYELVARMDTDDIALPDRFEKQIKCFEEDKDLSIVGSNIAEFIGDRDNVVSYRNVPASHQDICEFLKKRCPFNHMTVMFKKSEVERAGGYLDWHYDEDSYLWVRMYLAGCKFFNIQENLVFARINAQTFRRRGGYKYYKSERDLFKFMKKNKIIGFWAYKKAKFVRFVVYVLMTNGMRERAFKKHARK